MKQRAPDAYSRASPQRFRNALVSHHYAHYQPLPTILSMGVRAASARRPFSDGSYALFVCDSTATPLTPDGTIGVSVVIARTVGIAATTASIGIGIALQ